MSGGHFDYNQYRIREIADSIEQTIRNNGKKIEYNPPFIPGPFDDTHYPTFPPEVIEKFKEGLIILRQAEAYAQRIDWLLSGDDGNESFLRRLEEDLNKLEK